MIYFSPQHQTFFDDAIHTAEHIPADAQIIDETQHTTLLDALNRGAKIKSDLSIAERPSIVHKWQPETQEWILDKTEQNKVFQAALNQKLKVLASTSQDFVTTKTRTDVVPQFEQETYALQGLEAKAWAADKTADTPVLNRIADERGIPREILKAAALRKALWYEKVAASVAGQRQALQVRIESAKTLDDLNAIEITFRLPESE
ncbi:hypothetical protein [Wielerella bovis]|uniref:hypothetical protein n=1 Tax=Wielerella bovis TaxID=2917790 RepID=UPI002019A814|nr:hypothetical protein [Wielerella bovis]ULJ60778.1 hypothetical protein MIS44_02640 [Wielerella bovis]